MNLSLGELFPISFANLLNEFVLGELFPISIQVYTTFALGCLLNYLMNLFRAISYQLLGLHWRHTSSYDQSFILRQEFHPTTRVSSYDKSFILRLEFHPTTRVSSYDKSFILRQEFHLTRRVSSYDKSWLVGEYKIIILMGLATLVGWRR